MDKLMLLLFVCVFASFCESKPYRDYLWPRYHKRSSAEAQLQPCLDKINELRAKHSAKPLEWGKYEIRDAEQYAKKLAASGVIVKDLQEEASDKEGESIYKVSGVGSPAEKCIKAVDHWYSQVQKYVNGGGCNSDNGVKGTEDFSSLVWKSTDAIGLAVVGNIVDARYFPHGNFEYEFSLDVEC